MASAPGGNSELGIGKFLEKNPGVPDIAFHRIGQVLHRIILTAGCGLGGGYGSDSGVFGGRIGADQSRQSRR